VADAPLYGENAIVHAQALGILDGACCFSHRPLGYPIVLAGAYAVLGEGPVAIEVLNVVFAAVTAWLVWDIGRVSWGRRVAAVAATAYAVAPSQVLMALVPLTEPMFTMLVAGAVRAGIALRHRPMLVAGIACAVLLAAGQYVRATAVSLLIPVALLPWLAGWPLRRALQRAGLIGGLLVVLLLPVVAYNLRVHGDLSLSTSAYAGWSLYVGANREHGGQWNAEDAARLAGFPGDTWWDRSEYAGSLALDRVMESPAGSLALLPTKFGTQWNNETYAASYALRARAITRDVEVGWLVSQLFWAPLAILAAVGMYAGRRDPRPATLLIGMTITLVAVTHLALEVHSRYHAYLVPLFCLLAAAGVQALHRWWRGRRFTLAAG
jgi:4-amino-4-deoxy-L-arabinose transferase-like glycosyltransferase